MPRSLGSPAFLPYASSASQFPSSCAWRVFPGHFHFFGTDITIWNDAPPYCCQQCLHEAGLSVQEDGYGVSAPQIFAEHYRDTLMLPRGGAMPATACDTLPGPPHGRTCPVQYGAQHTPAAALHEAVVLLAGAGPTFPDPEPDGHLPPGDQAQGLPLATGPPGDPAGPARL